MPRRYWSPRLPLGVARSAPAAFGTTGEEVPAADGLVLAILRHFDSGEFALAYIRPGKSDPVGGVIAWGSRDACRAARDRHVAERGGAL